MNDCNRDGHILLKLLLNQKLIDDTKTMKKYLEKAAFSTLLGL
jgi:hypothetical protein